MSTYTVILLDGAFLEQGDIVEVVGSMQGYPVIKKIIPPPDAARPPDLGVAVQETIRMADKLR